MIHMLFAISFHMGGEFQGNFQVFLLSRLIEILQLCPVPAGKESQIESSPIMITLQFLMVVDISQMYTVNHLMLPRVYQMTYYLLASQPMYFFASMLPAYS